VSEGERYCWARIRNSIRWITRWRDAAKSGARLSADIAEEFADRQILQRGWDNFTAGLDASKFHDRIELKKSEFWKKINSWIEPLYVMFLDLFLQMKRAKPHSIGSASFLIPEMFVDPWIWEYGRLQDSALRARLTRHLSSATRESIESRAARLRPSAPDGEEIVLHF
jgi:hypothetical protein